MRFPNVVPPNNWSIAFAWFPVRTDKGVWVWLETYKWRWRVRDCGFRWAEWKEREPIEQEDV